MNGRSKASDGADETDPVAAITSRLQGAVSAAIGMAPLAIMSNPAACIPKNTSSTAIQYAAAILAGFVRITWNSVGRAGCRSANLASQSFSKWDPYL
jgi:hypothetical protein